jgi:hypothetical protein
MPGAIAPDEHRSGHFNPLQVAIAGNHSSLQNRQSIGLSMTRQICRESGSPFVEAVRRTRRADEW